MKTRVLLIALLAACTTTTNPLPACTALDPLTVTKYFTAVPGFTTSV